MRHCSCALKQKRRHFHTKMTSAKFYIYNGVGAWYLYIDETHTALDIFRFAAFFFNLLNSSLIETRKIFGVDWEEPIAIILSLHRNLWGLKWFLSLLILNKSSFQSHQKLICFAASSQNLCLFQLTRLVFVVIICLLQIYEIIKCALSYVFHNTMRHTE